MAVQISGNDITVPRDGTFTRNVTIGGTLTYEDVTNIDSVGLITARTGIEIGARPGVAASISVDGNMIVSGITTLGSDAIINTVKVGKGANSATGNTVLGELALDASVTGTNNTSETTLEPDPEYAPSSLIWKKLTFGGLSILVMANEQSSAKVKDLNSGDWEKQSYQWDASGTNATLYLDGTPQDKDKVLKLTFTSNAGGSVEWENWDTDTNGQNFLKESGTDTFTIADFTAEELPSTKGWMWFDLYPWVYSHVEGDWLYFLASGSTLMIYSAKDEAWREME